MHTNTVQPKSQVAATMMLTWDHNVDKVFPQCNFECNRLISTTDPSKRLCLVTFCELSLNHVSIGSQRWNHKCGCEEKHRHTRWRHQDFPLHHMLTKVSSSHLVTPPLPPPKGLLKTPKSWHRAAGSYRAMKARLPTSHLTPLFTDLTLHTRWRV